MFQMLKDHDDLQQDTQHDVVLLLHFRETFVIPIKLCMIFKKVL